MTHTTAIAATSPSPLVSLRGIGKHYGSLTVLHDIHLDIQAGEFLAITGPSGSGKSTLLGILGLLERPSRGTHLISGVDAWSLSDAEQSRLRGSALGFVFQQFHLLPELTALDNVARPLRLNRRGGDWRAEAHRMLERVGLAHRAGHRPAQLSGGEQQRVAIARALIRRPQLLLADEPTGNLPPAMWGDILELFRELNTDGHTVVVVTHDPLVARRASRNIRMEGGVTERANGPSAE
ncbi:ABC transporter ATP-binding protein [Deinococcus radiotolerans]|uniref:ABC transporter ATP-binding protein n=1 Tax=Deinococcus radiotolerans TaxID=1309407 RepID=A0ABQ2FRR9_9DEIO|nr:ABC transporter ATP-binding protein [Deinococcus radiotolerans]GGL20059.1 ABC transporter ATP-binding protein [Deinococcus radiotolerans]